MDQSIRLRRPGEEQPHEFGQCCNAELSRALDQTSEKGIQPHHCRFHGDAVGIGSTLGGSTSEGIAP